MRKKPEGQVVQKLPADSATGEAEKLRKVPVDLKIKERLAGLAIARATHLLPGLPACC